MGLAADLQGKLQVAQAQPQMGGTAAGGAAVAAVPQAPQLVGPWAAAVRSAQQPQPAGSTSAPRQQQQQRPRPSAGPDTEEQWQMDAADQLQRQHPGIAGDVVSAVLSAVGYDLGTAEAILADMALPAGSGPARTGSCPEPLGAGSSSSRGESEAAEEVEDNGWSSGDDEYGPPCSAAVEPGDWALPTGAPRQLSRSRGGARQLPFHQSHRLGRPVAVPEAAAAPAAAAAAAGLKPLSIDSSSSGKGGAEDLYWRHRGEALQLQKAAQRAVKKAAAAYSGGNHSKARLLAAEAQQLREQSQAAHEAAAARIESELNASCGCAGVAA